MPAQDSLSRAALVSLLFALPVASAPGRVWQVDPDRGDDTGPGPLRTIAAAIALAGPGDRVELAPALYREALVLADKSGEPGRPIVIDGQGATLTGCDVVPAGSLSPAGPGRWRFAAPTMPELLVIDGRAARQGRLPTHRGKPETLPDPEALAPGQWTWRDGWVVVRHDAAEPPHLEVCVRDAGVRLSGRCDHLVFRNLVCRHHWNDGFNIHGRCRDVRFERIVGYENMDEGFSAHEWCECDIRDAEFYGNDNGVADVNRCQTVYHNVFTHDNLEVGFLFTGGRHWVFDSRSVGDGRPLSVGPGETLPDDDPIANLLAEPDVLFSDFVAIGRAESPPIAPSRGRVSYLNTTFVNVTPTVLGGPAMFRWCLFAGATEVRRLHIAEAARALTLSDQNLFEPGEIVCGPLRFSAAQFAEYQRQTGYDARSVCADAQLDASGRPAPESPAYALRQGPARYGAHRPDVAAGPGAGVPHHHVTE